MSAPTNAIPLYEQVRREIQALIESSHQPGDTLPSQHTLAQGTGASLITVKRALSELAREGIVESARGRGTIVRRKPVADDTPLEIGSIIAHPTHYRYQVNLIN